MIGVEEMSKVVALVEYNKDLAIVLEESVNFNYEKHGNVIIGVDDTKTFVRCYTYGEPYAGVKAFGGSKFDITLTSGEIIHCTGQWWDGGYEEASRILGVTLESAIYGSIEKLKHCYVYYSATAVKSKLDALKKSYVGKVWNSTEFEKQLKSIS